MKKYFFLILFCLTGCYSYAQLSKNIDFRSQVRYTNPCSSLTGYADAGREYALVGTWEGVSIVDVTNPDQPQVLFNIPSAIPKIGNIVYREIKTFKKYAYAVNEQDSGLLIIDLKNLPDTVAYHHYKGNGIKTAHQLWIDENGILYLFGYNTDFVPINGVMLFDLNTNPEQPQFISQFSGTYLHNGFVRGDTLWGAAIYQGQLIIYDIKDKNRFNIIGQKTTPLAFCHSAYPTSDNHYVFTTDEKANGSLSSYDVSKTKSIPPVLDMVQSNPGSNSIPLNVVLYSDSFALCSYYRDGIVLFDVSHPDNMIEVGYYDTSPLTGDGINGAWEVYPFLPSGNLIVSDIEEGLFVLTPHYRLASRLEGTVTDSATGSVLNNVQVEIISGSIVFSDYMGKYKTGIADSGTVAVRFSKSGYSSKTSKVDFKNGLLTTLDINLSPLTSSVSVQPEENFTFRLTSNPFSSKAEISYSLPNNSSNHITVTDLSGVVLAAYPLNNKSGTIDVGDNLSQGFYFISLYSENKLLKTIKGIKQ